MSSFFGSTSTITSNSITIDVIQSAFVAANQAYIVGTSQPQTILVSPQQYKNYYNILYNYSFITDYHFYINFHYASINRDGKVVLS